MRTAVGHKIHSNRGGSVCRKVEGCRVQRVTPSGHVILLIPDADRAYFQDIDRRLKADLDLPNGPWNYTLSTLLVKFPRGCKVFIGGVPAGSKEDLLPGRSADAVVSLTGAYQEGYVWQVSEVTLGPVEQVVTGG